MAPMVPVAVGATVGIVTPEAPSMDTAVAVDTALMATALPDIIQSCLRAPAVRILTTLRPTAVQPMSCHLCPAHTAAAIPLIRAASAATHREFRLLTTATIARRQTPLARFCRPPAINENDVP